MKDNCAVNRAKLIDEPIVEMLLSRKYLNSGLKFMKSDIQSDFDGTDIVCYFNGVKRNLNVKRNSSKYYSSPNFTISLDKNNLEIFNNTSFVFIDEVADSLYVVDGTALLKYILNNTDNIKQSANNSNKSFVILPKKDILSIIGNSENCVIKYNKQIARLFEMNRDEAKFKNLFSEGIWAKLFLLKLEM